jgi:Uma2 family endonuclease
MSTQPHSFLKPEQYLAMDREADARSEYYDGEMFAMAGGTGAHSNLNLMLALVVGNRLNRQQCRMFGSDMRIQVSATGLYTYADFAVVCGESQFADKRTDTLLNPVLIAEVLSPSTEVYDRTDKFAHYRTIPALKYYVLVSQDRVLVETYTHVDSQWALSAAAEPGDLVQFPAIQVEFPVDQLYDGVELPPSAPSRWPKRITPE